MEADGNSENFCAYCSKPGHQMYECRERTSEIDRARRINIAIGMVAGLIMIPFAVIGYILGAVAGAIWGGASHSWKYWPEWVSYMKRLFGKNRS
jgi:hypothetical protein